MCSLPYVSIHIIVPEDGSDPYLRYKNKITTRSEIKKRLELMAKMSDGRSIPFIDIHDIITHWVLVNMSMNAEKSIGIEYSDEFIKAVIAKMDL